MDGLNVTAALLLAGILAFLTLLITLFTIREQLLYNSDRKMRSSIVRILLMAPLYAGTSCLGIAFPDTAPAWDVFREVYEAIVIYSLFQLMVTYLGGEDRLREILAGRPEEERPQHFFPCCCLPEWTTLPPPEPEGKTGNPSSFLRSHDRTEQEEESEEACHHHAMQQPSSSSSSFSAVTSRYTDRLTYGQHRRRRDGYSKLRSSPVEHSSSSSISSLSHPNLFTWNGDPSSKLSSSSSSSSSSNVIELTEFFPSDGDFQTEGALSRPRQRGRGREDGENPDAHGDDDVDDDDDDENWNDFFQNTQIGIYQYVLLRPLTALLAFLFHLVGVYDQGEFTWDRAVINNAAQMWAMYCLVLFYNALGPELAPIRPLMKFLSVKFVVFFTFWQGLLIEILVQLEMIDGIGDRNPTQVGHSLQNLFIGLEMVAAAILHIWAFDPKDFHDTALKSESQPSRGQDSWRRSSGVEEAAEAVQASEEDDDTRETEILDEESDDEVETENDSLLRGRVDDDDDGDDDDMDENGPVREDRNRYSNSDGPPALQESFNSNSTPAVSSAPPPPAPLFRTLWDAANLSDLYLEDVKIVGRRLNPIAIHRRLHRGRRRWQLWRQQQRQREREKGRRRGQLTSPAAEEGEDDEETELLLQQEEQSFPSTAHSSADAKPFFLDFFSDRGTKRRRPAMTGEEVNPSSPSSSSSSSSGSVLERVLSTHRSPVRVEFRTVDDDDENDENSYDRDDDDDHDGEHGPAAENEVHPSVRDGASESMDAAAATAALAAMENGASSTYLFSSHPPPSIVDVPSDESQPFLPAASLGGIGPCTEPLEDFEQILHLHHHPSEPSAENASILLLSKGE